MANTERLKTIQMVRDARDAVGLARIETTLTDEQRSALDRIYSKLDGLEGRLILKEIQEVVDEVTRDAQDLEDLTSRMEKSVRELKEVGEKVEKAARAVRVLVNIASAAASAGLV